MLRILAIIGLVGLTVGLGIFAYKTVGAQQLGSDRTRNVPGYASVDIPDVSLGPPSSAARMTSNAALELVKNDHWSPSLFTHPISVEYGSYTDPGLRTLSAGEIVPLGQRDVWRVTITGLNIPRPGGPGGDLPSSQRPPPVSTLVIFVDDKDGKVLEAEGY